MQAKKNKNTAVILGVAFVWFTTHFGGGFASGAQIYSYFVKYGIACLILPVLAMVYNGVFFAYSLRFARKHEVYDYRSYNNAFYGRFAPVFSNLFEVLYICVMCVAPAVAFATGGATLRRPYRASVSAVYVPDRNFYLCCGCVWDRPGTESGFDPVHMHHCRLADRLYSQYRVG